MDSIKMNSSFISWLIFPLCIILILSTPVSATNVKRTALIIGNGNYVDAPLRNPVNDAKDMANALTRLGFKVTLKTDATQRDVEDAIRNFGIDLRAGGVGLFYFAGHGIQYRGQNYLIPIRANIKSEADVKYEAVDAGRVLSQMEDAGNDLNIIILDACRNNPFARSFRSGEQGLAKMDAPTGSILAYSTSPGSVAADGYGKNGLYTENLLKHINTPGITVERMFKLVRREVTSASSKEQVPWESSSLIGDFYFVPQRGITVKAKTGDTSPPKTNPSTSPVKTHLEGSTMASVNPALYSKKPAFIISRALGVRSARELSGATICVYPGSTAERVAFNYFRNNNMQWSPIIIERHKDFKPAFLAGRCDCIVEEHSFLTKLRASAPNPKQYDVYLLD